MTLEVGRRWVNGRWETDIRDESSSGSSLPTNVDWDESELIVHEAADSGPLTPILFRLKTLLASGLELSVRVAAYFTGAVTTYNDNGDELLESDPLANGGDGEVRISGVAVVTQTDLSGLQATSAKGQANGYASLDGGGIVPIAQLPDAIAGAGGALSLTGPINLLAVEDGAVSVLAPGAGASTTVGTDGSGVHTTEIGVAIYGPGLSFFGAPIASQPTGVAVTAEAIHAALVNLGLITA